MCTYNITYNAMYNHEIIYFDSLPDGAPVNWWLAKGQTYLLINSLRAAPVTLSAL